MNYTFHLFTSVSQPPPTTLINVSKNSTPEGSLTCSVGRHPCVDSEIRNETAIASLDKCGFWFQVNAGLSQTALAAEVMGVEALSANVGEVLPI